jgi:hypothetical protein
MHVMESKSPHGIWFVIKELGIRKSWKWYNSSMSAESKKLGKRQGNLEWWWGLAGGSWTVFASRSM